MNQTPQPTLPTPEDPREKEPIHDPPVDPERDINQKEPVRKAGGVKAPEPQLDQVVFDANKTER